MHIRAVNLKKTTKKLPPEIENFIQKLGIFYENVGLTNIAGKIMGFLLVWGEPVSPQQICSLLKVSRGSVSNSLRLLKAYGYLEEQKITGIRNRFYSLSDSAWKNSIRVKLQAYLYLTEIIQEGRKIVERNQSSTQIFDEALVLIQKEQNFYNNVIKNWEEEVINQIQRVK